MKVAMVTPMSPESAIADVMVQAVSHLGADWDIEIWCPTEPAYRSCPVPLRPFVEPDADVLGMLQRFDLVIYVLGNSPWHSRIVPLARALPGLVVLHDVAMTDLVRHCATERGEMDLLLRQVTADSTPELAETLRTATHPDGQLGWLRFSAEVPLDRYAIEGSLGAVVHSVWHARRVDGLTLGDVTVAPLPVPSTRLGLEVNQRANAPLLLDQLPQDALLLVTVGAVNRNRRIDLLLDAVADDPVLAERLHVWAVGSAADDTREDLGQRARRLGLAEKFAVTGRVSDRLLQDILTRADIAVALRDPVLEGQSASVLTQLLSATPVVVYDHAHYAELPDDVAVKIGVTDTVAGLRRALRSLVDDDAERRSRGERGRDYVLATRSGEKYAQALLGAGARALATRPLAHLSPDLAARLRRLDLHGEPAVVSAVTDLAFELFDLA